jgi:hypothetical protein
LNWLSARAAGFHAIKSKAVPGYGEKEIFDNYLISWSKKDWLPEVLELKIIQKCAFSSRPPQMRLIVLFPLREKGGKRGK